MKRSELLKLQTEYSDELTKIQDRFTAIEAKFNDATSPLEIDHLENERQKLLADKDALGAKVRRTQTSIDDLELADRLTKQKTADAAERARKLSLFNSYTKQPNRLPKCKRCGSPTRIVESPPQPEFLSGTHWVIPTNGKHSWDGWWISLVCPNCLLCQRHYPDQPDLSEKRRGIQ